MQGTALHFKRHLHPRLHPRVARRHRHSTCWYIVRVVSISLWNSPLKHGIQQPQVTSMVATTDVDVCRRTEASSPLHQPTHFSIMPVKGTLIPEFSASSAESDVSPFKALVMLPSGEVLLGKKFRTFYTPASFSASNMSKAILFCYANREVGPNCSAMPYRCNLFNQHSYLLLPSRKDKIQKAT